MMNLNYESPKMEVLDFVTEGVLCASGVTDEGTDMIPGTGNM